MKRIFYISLALFLLTLIFLGAYNFAFRHNVNNPAAGTAKKAAEPEAAPSEETAPATEIAQPLSEAVLGAVSGPDGLFYYYSQDDQSIKKASFEGKDKTVLMSNLPGIPTRITWTPKRDRALLSLRLPNGKNQWYFADFGTKALVALKPEASRATWNNLGDKIFYEYTDPKSGRRSLNISNPDGSSWKTLVELGSTDSFIAPVPQSTLVSFWNRPSALEKSTIKTVGTTGETEATLMSDKYGGDYLWSPNGQYLLVSSSDQKGGHALMLTIANNRGGEAHSLSIPTLISKIVWSKDSSTLYYALPAGLPDSATLPNDYYDKFLPTSDTFWKMDIQTGRKSRVLDLKDVGQSFDSADLFLSPREDILFFTDRRTKKLNRIDL